MDVDVEEVLAGAATVLDEYQRSMGEQEDAWTVSAAEARDKSGKSALAKKLEKKKANTLRDHGFGSPKASGSTADLGTEGPSTAVQGEKPIRRAHFIWKRYFYVVMDLHGGNDGIKTTIAVAEKMRSMLTLLGTNLAFRGAH